MGKKQARHRRILAELEQRPALRVAELAEMLAVSTETVRRDFDELSMLGQVSRTYGGAVRRSSSEPSVNERHHLLVAERERLRVTGDGQERLRVHAWDVAAFRGQAARLEVVDASPQGHINLEGFCYVR